jgi:hypothetical protein
MGIRRVVTGIDASGKTVVISDAEAPVGRKNDVLGAWAVPIWQMLKMPPKLSDDGATGATVNMPGPGGLVFRVIQFPPESILRANREEAKKHYGREDFDSKDAGMHANNAIDLVVVLSGEIWMGLRDAGEIHLKEGDTLVQRGAMHAWHNRSNKPCILAAVTVGGQKKD